MLDLFLIHWPLPMFDLYVDTWRAFEKLQADGRIRSIGVSNFEIEHLERLAAETGTVPAVNQVELHPQFPQAELRAYHAEHGIITESWGPLGQGKGLLEDPRIARGGSGQGPYAGSGGAALAPAAGLRGDPQVGHPPADRGEPGRVRLRTRRRRHGQHRRRSTPGRISGPTRKTFDAR